MKNQSFATFQMQCFGRLLGLLFCAIGLFSISGCNQSAEDTGEIVDEWFSTGDEELQSSDAPSSSDDSSVRLGVQLSQGARFPLQKVVEKTLTQYTLQGPVENRERVELFMSVTVDEIRGQDKKFSVRYNRVQYSSDMNSQRIVYDSQHPPYPIPDAVLAYHGMVNNGFSFWVGPDNKITEVVDFHSFMQRCLMGVPKHKADQVAETLSQYSGQDGIANFIDDTIGLLPYDPNSKDGSMIVRIGGHWTKSRQYTNPVPMTLTNKYKLLELNDSIAQIEIQGEILPSAAVTSSHQVPVSLQIQDGHSIGSCTIDRKTGLPLQSRVDHLLNMTVQMNGHQFKQQKRVVTSIRMFPDQNSGEASQETARKAPRKSDLVLTPASLEKSK